MEVSVHFGQAENKTKKSFWKEWA